MKLGSPRFTCFLPALRAFSLVAAVWAPASCHEIDTTRIAPAKATLGDDMFGVFCDRIGASALTEDVTGASFHAVCHYDASGKYAAKVDVSGLPTPSQMDAAGRKARALSIAKVETMASHRNDLIHAVNALFPDVEIDDVTSKEPKKIRLHDALLDFSQTLVPLYESNPIDPKGEPLFPANTRSLARLFAALADSEPARKALSQINGRRGYRPSPVALGAIRAALGYPKLRDFTTASLEVIGPGGSGEAELQHLLGIVKKELLTSKPVVAPLPAYAVDNATVQPNRPRSDIEVTAAMLLPPSAALAEGAFPAFIAARDRRGLVKTVLSAPFVDKNGDGLADVDAFDRFVDAAGKPLSVDPPFAIPELTQGSLDSFGRPSKWVNAYSYVDTVSTPLGAIARHLVPLIDATVTSKSGTMGWKDEHETLMYALAGAYTLYGARKNAVYDYANEQIDAEGVNCKGCIPYTRFEGEKSPLADLLHAAGQVLADPDSDAILASLTDLVDNHEQAVARLLGAALKIQDIALHHDEASMPYETPIWDEMAKLLSDITSHPGLTEQLLVSLAGDAVVTPHAPSQHMGDTIAAFLENRDAIGYDKTPGNVNGPTINFTDGYPSVLDPHNPVDRQKPLSGDNRSCLQRSFKIIHDANGGPACNKDNAKVKASISGLTVTWPILGAGYKQCELFSFDNLAVFYLDSMLPLDHPKRSLLQIKSGTLNAIMSFLGVFVPPDKVFEQSSGITGLTLHPEAAALNRLVFFGATQGLYPSMPLSDDLLNHGGLTDAFVSSLIEPVSCAWCPPNAMGIPTCPTSDGTLREAGPNTIFLWEHLGFYDYLKPLVLAFANATPSDPSGEKLFVQAIDILHRHWPGKEHGPECTSSGGPDTNGQYCSEAGVNTYEPLLTEAFRGDIIPALHEFAKVATELSKVTVKRGAAAGATLTGAQVLEKVTKILFNVDYAKAAGMVDRHGNAGTTWVNGNPQAQVTGYSLFADALHALDVRWDKACDALSGTAQQDCKTDTATRKGQWKRARSQLVDEFLAVDGTGPAAKFHNVATPRVLSTMLGVIREQLNANCPQREDGASTCTWAKKGLDDKLATTMSGPLFAALMDVQEKLRQNEPARRKLEQLLTYVITDERVPETLASISDLLQVMADDGDLSPIFNAVAVAASPDGDAEGVGPGAMTLKVLKALTGDQYDRYHVLDSMLPNLVTPIPGAAVSPIEVFMDTIADVNRLDAAAAATEQPLATDDYKAIMGTVNDFITSKTRGLEQFYTIVQQRPRP